MDNTELQRYVGIALGGAVAAVAADFVYNRYGGEIRELLREALHMIVESGAAEEVVQSRAPRVDRV